MITHNAESYQNLFGDFWQGCFVLLLLKVCVISHYNNMVIIDLHSSVFFKHYSNLVT